MFLLSVFMNFFDKKKKNTKDVTSIPFRTKIVQPCLCTNCVSVYLQPKSKQTSEGNFDMITELFIQVPYL